MRPSTYNGLMIADVERDTGLGSFISGTFDLSDTGKIKAFGILGTVGTPNMGFAKTLDVDVTKDLCTPKSVMLNLYPTLGYVDNSPANSIVIDIEQGEFREFTLTTETLVSAPASPSTPVDDDLINILNGVVVDGAAYLSAAAAAVSLAAFTLY